MKHFYRFTFPVIILFITICVMPFNHIFAEEDENTYLEVQPYTCTPMYVDSGKTYQYYPNTVQRLVVIETTSRQRLYSVSLASNSKYQRSSNWDSCPLSVDSWYANLQSATYNGITYYYASVGYRSQMDYDSNLPVYVDKSLGNLADVKELAYRLTYGDLSVDPKPDIIYGSLKTGYSTKFVSENFVGVDSHNIDTITWEETDTNGNFLMSPGSMVEIRAVPGYFEAPSKTVLESQTITNFIKGLWAKSPLPNSVVDIQPVEYYTIGRFTPNKKSVDIMWKDVVDTFWYNSEQPFLGSLYSEVWYKIGWRYEIRFYVGDYEDPDYVSDWQTIYQITSVDVQTSNNVIQQAPQGLTPELYNLLQTVNTLNNTVQNWNINGVPIQLDPNNTPTQDNSWIEKLIESIANMFGKLIDAIGDIVSAILGIGSDFINGIFNLINNLGINILDTFSDLWNNFINLFNGIDFSDNNPEFDIDFNLVDGDSPLDVVPAFVRMIYDSGLGYILWMPLIVGIIFMIV